jgi:peroxiredoxin Q/BCP
MLSTGQKVPLTIKVVDSDGTSVSLQDLLSQWVVLYFYPKDDTPGCTKEACSIRDVRTELKKKKVVVVGVSKDSPKSHQKFIDKYKLNFTLWSDEEHKLQEAFGVWQKKKFMGREYMGTIRATFIINPEGKIAYVFESVTVDGHGEAILEKLEELQAA